MLFSSTVFQNNIGLFCYRLVIHQVRMACTTQWCIIGSMQLASLPYGSHSALQIPLTWKMLIEQVSSRSRAMVSYMTFLFCDFILQRKLNVFLYQRNILKESWGTYWHFLEDIETTQILKPVHWALNTNCLEMCLYVIKIGKKEKQVTHQPHVSVLVAFVLALFAFE